MAPRLAPTSVGLVMARGWESKSVEAQQEEAAATGKPKPPMTAEAVARESQRATLMLARTEKLAQLQRACVPAHRAMLEQAIANLDQKISNL